MSSLSLPVPAMRIAYLILAAVLIALLFYLGSKPFAAGLFPPPWDKLAHFSFYALITVLLAQGVGPLPAWVLVALVGGVGFLDEVHQLFVPGRSADLGDWATDIVAAICVVLVLQGLAMRVRPKPGSSGPASGE